MSLLLMPTTATPRARYSRVSSASCERTCLTYGQWFDRNMTRSAGAPWKSSRLTTLPSVSGSEKSGAGVPNGVIVEAVATMRLPLELGVLVWGHVEPRASMRTGSTPGVFVVVMREASGCDRDRTKTCSQGVSAYPRLGVHCATCARSSRWSRRASPTGAGKVLVAENQCL